MAFRGCFFATLAAGPSALAHQLPIWSYANAIKIDHLDEQGGFDIASSTNGWGWDVGGVWQGKAALGNNRFIGEGGSRSSIRHGTGRVGD